MTDDEKIKKWHDLHAQIQYRQGYSDGCNALFLAMHALVLNSDGWGPGDIAAEMRAAFSELACIPLEAENG